MSAIVRYQTSPEVLRQGLKASGLLESYRAEISTWLQSAKRSHRQWLRSLAQGRPDTLLKANRNAYLSLVRALRP